MLFYVKNLKSILRTFFEAEAETRILQLAFDLSKKTETRIRSLAV